MLDISCFIDSSGHCFLVSASFLLHIFFYFVARSCGARNYVHQNVSYVVVRASPSPPAARSVVRSVSTLGRPECRILFGGFVRFKSNCSIIVVYNVRFYQSRCARPVEGSGKWSSLSSGDDACGCFTFLPSHGALDESINLLFICSAWKLLCICIFLSCTSCSPPDERFARSVSILTTQSKTMSSVLPRLLPYLLPLP